MMAQKAITAHSLQQKRNTTVPVQRLQSITQRQLPTSTLLRIPMEIKQMQFMDLYSVLKKQHLRDIQTRLAEQKQHSTISALQVFAGMHQQALLSGMFHGAKKYQIQYSDITTATNAHA